MALDSTLSPVSVNIPLPGPSAQALRLWLGFGGKWTLLLRSASCWSMVKELKISLYTSPSWASALLVLFGVLLVHCFVECLAYFSPFVVDSHCPYCLGLGYLRDSNPHDYLLHWHLLSLCPLVVCSVGVRTWIVLELMGLSSSFGHCYLTFLWILGVLFLGSFLWTDFSY